MVESFWLSYYALMLVELQARKNSTFTNVEVVSELFGVSLMLRTRFTFAFAAAVALGAVARPAVAQEAVATPAALPMATQFLSDLVQSQYVQVDSKGTLKGDISYLADDGTRRSLPNLDVSLIQGGQFVERVMTNPDGEFAISGVRPGIYTVIASNPKQLLVLPIVVTGTADEPTSLALIAASPVAPARRQAMLTSLLMGDPGLGVVYDDSIDYGTGHASPTIGRVAVGGDGALQGRISVIGFPVGAVDMTGMTIRVMRGGEPMASVPVNADGTFTVEKMSVGPIAVFAFGPQGFAAMGVEVFSGDQLTKNITNGTETLVTAMQAPPSTLSFEIAPPNDVIAGSQLPGDSFTGPTLPPGPVGPLGAGPGGAFGGPGGGFGGGGGGGGFAGGGGLGALGALGAAAAALANDNDNGFVPSPVSGAGF